MFFFFFLHCERHTNRFLCEVAACQGKVCLCGERERENVTNRTEIINSSLKKAATHERSCVRGLWPVSHIMEQSLRHSSSAMTAFKKTTATKKKCKKNPAFYPPFVPFLPLSLSSSSSVLLFVSSASSLRSVLGHHLPLFLHHDALCHVFGSRLF